MSKLAAQDEQKAAERKANAMKMNYTKVKPTVVKHVLQEEVMSIYDIKVSGRDQYLSRRVAGGAAILCRRNLFKLYCCVDPHEAVLLAN